MPLLPETIEQIKLFQFISSTKSLKSCSFHIPNEGKRTPQMGYLMKRMGMRPGVSDIFVAYPTLKYHGLFLELKAATKTGTYRTPTPAQLVFIEDMKKQGYAAEVCNGADAAIALIKKYMKNIL